jgi:hypothetical protein
LEGLEISEIWLSEVLADNQNIRLDAEYFKKIYLHFFKDVPNLHPLGNFVSEGYRVVYETTEIINSEEGKEKNYPIFLQATDLQTPFIKMDRLYYVHEKDWLRYPKGRITKGEILIEVKGKIEKVAIVPNDFPEKVLVTGSLYKMTVNDKINKHYLLTYLICKYGNVFKERYKTNLLISFLSKDDLYKIPVPIFSVDFQNQIEKLYNKIFEFQKQSKTLYTTAENLLLSTLGLNDFESKKVETNYNIKSFKDSFLTSGRLDAEYYQPKYEELEKRIREYEGGFCKIGDYFTQNKSTFTRNKKGFNYIEIGDISVSDGSVGFNFVETENLPDNAKIKANKGDLLVSKVRPNRGAVAIIDFEQEDLVCSGAFTVLQENKNSTIKKETLQVFLRLENIKDLLLKYNCGTSYPVIKDEDILTLEIPLFSQEIQTEISLQVQESFRLRAESERLLALAKEAVEVAIEQGETEAMFLITNYELRIT